MLNKASAI